MELLSPVQLRIATPNMNPKCVFCTKVANEGREIMRNDLAWAFLTNIPIVPGHGLICPMRRVATFDDLTSQEREALFNIRTKLKTALIKTFGAEGFNYAWNEGKDAGQAVPHLHLHILPRKKDDAGITEYEPRKFLYRPGSREESPESGLWTVTEMIRKQIE